MQVFYSPSQKYGGVIDEVKNGRGRYSGASFEETAKTYPDLEIIAAEEAVHRDRNRRITTPRAVEAGYFDEMLNVLPPCKWYRGADSEAFHMSERITYDITTWCVRLGDKHYIFDDTDTLTAQQAIELVAAFVRFRSGISA
jgi:hypothetical protein